MNKRRIIIAVGDEVDNDKLSAVKAEAEEKNIELVVVSGVGDNIVVVDDSNTEPMRYLKGMEDMRSLADVGFVITNPHGPHPKKIKGYAANIRTEPKINRNDPCPCNSGKKYKKCCLTQKIGD